jgi:hypothetical protein
MGAFFAELKQRNVYKIAIACAVVGWLLVQIATQVFPFFAIPKVERENDRAPDTSPPRKAGAWGGGEREPFLEEQAAHWNLLSYLAPTEMGLGE